MTDLAVNLNKTIHSPIEKVFDAWLNPKTLSKFILPMAGMAEPKTETDAREGGEFSIIMNVGEEKIPHTGKYLEITRPNKLVFTWNSPFSAGNSVVTLNFDKIDENSTNIKLSHTKFPDEESRVNHEDGWDNILIKLDNVLTSLNAVA